MEGGKVRELRAGPKSEPVLSRDAVVRNLEEALHLLVHFEPGIFARTAKLRHRFDGDCANAGLVKNDFPRVGERHSAEEDLHSGAALTDPWSHAFHQLECIRRRGGRKQIIGPDGAVARQGDCRAGIVPVRGDPALIKALARGFRWRRMLEEGRYAFISEMAKAEGIERGYVRSLLRLTLLAPAMVEAIVAGRQPEGVTLPGQLEGMPVGWGEQTGDKSSP
jgi:hypothetical protein